MKKCKYCGTPQSDERHTCVDCGRPLPKPLSDAEAEVIGDALDAKINRTAYHDDVFCVTRTDKILGIIGIVGLLAAVVLFCVSLTERNQIQNAWEEKLMQAIQSGDPFGTIEVIDPTKPRTPSREDFLDRSVGGASVAILFFLISAVLLLAPRFFWWWNTVRYRIRYNEEPAPSAFDAACIKFFKYAGLVIGTAALLFSAWMYF